MKNRKSVKITVEERVAIIAKDFINPEVDNNTIPEKYAKEWGITTRQVYKYINMAKAEYVQFQHDNFEAERNYVLEKYLELLREAEDDETTKEYPKRDQRLRILQSYAEVAGIKKQTVTHDVSDRVFKLTMDLG